MSAVKCSMGMGAVKYSTGMVIGKRKKHLQSKCFLPRFPLDVLG